MNVNPLGPNRQESNAQRIEKSERKADSKETLKRHKGVEDREQDTVEVSSVSKQAKALVSKLDAYDVVSEERIKKAKELIANGNLSSQERISNAAEGILQAVKFGEV